MNRAISRREFAGMSLAFAASLRAGQMQTSFPAEPRKRLSVSTYPFRAFISANAAKPGMTLAQFAATIVEKFNVPGIEPWSHHFESIEPGYVEELGHSFKNAGVHVVNIPCDVRAQLCGTPEQRAETLATYRKWVDAALLLGSPSIRVHVPRTASTEDIACAVDGLKDLAAYGAEKSIVINLENDDPRSEDPFRIVKIIQAVNTPYLRALPDFGNSRQLGDEQYNERALRTLFPLAFNISHVKNGETIGGKLLPNDMDAIFKIAQEAKYHGYFSMEWDTTGGDPYEGTKQLIARSLKDLSAA